MYNIFLFFHILCAIIGFGTMALSGINFSTATRMKGEGGLAIFESAKKTQNIAIGFVYAMFVFGVLIVLVAEDADMFTQTWLSISTGLFIVAVLIGEIGLRPTSHKLNLVFRQSVETASDSAIAQIDELATRTGILNGINNLIFVVILALMIFKPGAISS